MIAVPATDPQLIQRLRQCRDRLIASSALKERQGLAVLGQLFFGFDPSKLDELDSFNSKLSALFIHRCVMLRLLEDRASDYILTPLPTRSEERLTALEHLRDYLHPEVLSLFTPHVEYNKFFAFPERLDVIECLRDCDFRDASLRLLGDLFEGLLDAEERSELGQFYTPQRIVDFILDKTLEPLLAQSDVQSLRVMDPTCGCGHFLVEAYHRFFRVYRERFPGWSAGTIHQQILTNNLWGADLNPLSLQLTKGALMLLGLENGVVASPNLLLADSLYLYEQSGRGLGALVSEKIQKARELTYAFAGHTPSDTKRFFEPFDAVVGNPPYGAKLSRFDKAYYSENYKTAVGRYDTVSLFVERSLRLLREGGRLGFVIPHGFSRTGAYAPAREFANSYAKITHLANLLNAFEGVNLNAMVLCALKGASETVSLYDGTASSFSLIGEIPNTVYQSRSVWPIYLSSASYRILQQMEKAPHKLADLVGIRRGASISNRDPALVPRENDASLTPVIRGRDIRAYRNMRDVPLGIHGRDGLAVTSVGFQNIASRFQATLFPQGSLPLDTANYLELPDQRLLNWLVALLNSRALNYYLIQFVLNQATLTVHLDAPTIGELPIPVDVDFDTLNRWIAQAMQGGSTSQIEQAVYRAYGLTASDIQLMETEGNKK